MRILRISYGLGMALTVLLSFFFRPHHAIYLWHLIPSWEAIMGALGALLLLGAVKGIGRIVHREEDFYD